VVPLEIWDEDKAIRGIRVLKNNPVSFSLLVENVIHPLEGEGERWFSNPLTPSGVGQLSGPFREDTQL
jgi:hypothetical protein